MSEATYRNIAFRLTITTHWMLSHQIPSQALPSWAPLPFDYIQHHRLNSLSNPGVVTNFKGSNIIHRLKMEINLESMQEIWK
jgi:hypothetical protein